MFRFDGWQKYITGMVGLVISIIFIIIVLKDFDPITIYNTLLSANIYFILIALFFNLIDIMVRAFKWHFVLNGSVNLKNSFNSFFLGYGMNVLLPFRLGEFFRSYSLKSEMSVKKSLGLFTIERLIEGLLLIIIFGISLFWLNTDVYWLNYTFWFGLILLIIILILIILIIYKPDLVFYIINILHLTFLTKTFQMYLDGLEILKNRKYTFTLCGLTLFMWFIHSLMYYFVGLAFGFELSIGQIMLLVGISNLVSLIPSSSGAIGILEYAISQSLLLFGLSLSLGLSYALIIRIILTFNAILVIFIVFSRYLFNSRD